MARCLVMHPDDDVAVAVESIAAGDLVRLPDGNEFLARDPIPFAHKVAVHAIERNSPVRKYGEVIGAATKTISVGDHVHVHNIRSLRV